jgi:hypothetical protein
MDQLLDLELHLKIMTIKLKEPLDKAKAKDCYKVIISVLKMLQASTTFRLSSQSMMRMESRLK